MANSTPEQREEVAEKLRAKYRERNAPGMFEAQDVGMQAYNYLKDLESCLPDGESAFTVIADLIDPVCHASVMGYPNKYRVYKKCSACDTTWLEGVDNPLCNYCPNCGARIVEEKNHGQ